MHVPSLLPSCIISFPILRIWLLLASDLFHEEMHGYLALDSLWRYDDLI
jgi:hypothetical protein